MEDLQEHPGNFLDHEKENKALLQRIEELTDFIENAAVPLHWVDANGTIIWANQAELNALGYTKEEYIGCSISDFHADKQVIEDILTRLTNNETLHNYSARLKCKNGSVKHVLISSNVLRKDGKFIHSRCFSRDITPLVEEQERKARLLDELKESETRLQMAILSTRLGTWDYNPVTGELYWSDECRKIYGFADSRPVSYEEFLDHIHQDDKAHVKKELQRFLSTEENGAYELSFRILRFDNKAVRWIKVHGIIYRNGDEHTDRFIGTVLDITEEKQEEQKKNDFVAMLSHELKTPLTSIKAYLQVLINITKNDKDDFNLSVLRRTEGQAQKMISLIEDFLNLSRMESGRMQINMAKFDLHPLLTEVAADAQIFSQRHEIILSNCEQVVVNADREKIGQVLTNLLSNAIKYSPDGGTVTLGCEYFPGKVKIYVRDQGVGISREDQKKII